MAAWIENTQVSRDHLHLDAKIISARSATGFKVSILRGSLRFNLSRQYVARRIEVVMEGFKSVRTREQGNMNMNSGYEVRDMAESLCSITWILGEDVPLMPGVDYHFDFSALLDARLPRSIKAGSSRVYYRMSADIPNLRSLKTETRLTVPWSRSAIMAAEDADLTYEVSTVPIDQDSAMQIEVPKTVIKGPDRSVEIKIYPAFSSVNEINVTHVDVEILQHVSIVLQCLREPHSEPATVVQSAKGTFDPLCSKQNPLVISIPLPAEIHAEMVNPHMSCNHVLKVTFHRHGMFNRAKVHKQAIVLHHLDMDHWKGQELPLYEDVLTKNFNDPFYEYNAIDVKFADEQHNVL